MKIYKIEFRYTKDNGSEGNFAYHHKSLTGALDRLTNFFGLSDKERSDIEFHVGKLGETFYFLSSEFRDKVKEANKGTDTKAFPTCIDVDLLHD